MSREVELASVQRAVERGEPLVLIVGPPGIGRTWLARRIARWPGAALLTLDRLPRATDRVRVIDDVLPKDAEALLCASRPGSTLVATSAVRFELEGAEIVRLGPLPLDEGERLFVERAGGVDPARRATVRAIVAALGGHPLAIVTVAAWAGVRDLGWLEEKIAADPLVGDPLLRSLGASWALLDPEERIAAAECAAFRGGIAPEAADAVLSGDARARLGALDHHWLSRASVERLEMGPVQRAFAASALPEVTEAAAERHARWFLARFQERPRPLAAEDRRWVQQEAANLWEAIERGCALPIAPEQLLSAAKTLSSFGRSMSLASFRKTLERVLAVTADAPAEPRIGVWIQLADGIRHEGAPDEALPLARRGLSEARSSGRIGLIQHALEIVGDCLTDLRATEEGRAHYREALSLRPLTAHSESNLLNSLGTSLLNEGRYAEARQAFRAAAALRADDHPWRALNLACLGSAYLYEGHLTDARGCLLEAIAVGERSGDALIAALARRDFATYLLAEGDLPAAEEALQQAARAFEAAGWVREVALCHASFALIARHRGQGAEAEAHLRRASRLSSDRLHRAVCEAQLCAVLADRALADEARRHLDSALAASDAGPDWLRTLVELEGGHLALLEAERRLEKGDRSGAIAARASAVRARDSAADRRDEVPVYWRLLEQAIAASDARLVDRWAPSLSVRVDRLSFMVDGRTADCRRRPVLWALLWALVSQHRADPRSALSAEALVAAGWPGQRIRPDSARNRLHVAINQLRELGLREILLSDPDGYRLDPACRIQAIDDPLDPDRSNWR